MQIARPAIYRDTLRGSWVLQGRQVLLKSRPTWKTLRRDLRREEERTGVLDQGLPRFIRSSASFSSKNCSKEQREEQSGNSLLSAGKNRVP